MTSTGNTTIGRRLALLLAAIAGTVLLCSGVALAATITCQAEVDCFGTKYADTLNGTAGEDYNMYGRGGGDTIKGFGATDALYGQGGADKLLAGPSYDDVVGGAGNDSLSGGGGVDKFYFANGWGEDSIINETASGAELWFSRFYAVTVATDNLTIDLLAGPGPEVEDESGANTVNWEGDVINTVNSGWGNDHITGNASANALFAGGGTDVVFGGVGDDSIYVVDFFTGDTVHCGPGEDTVSYDEAPIGIVTDVVDSDCENLFPH